MGNNAGGVRGLWIWAPPYFALISIGGALAAAAGTLAAWWLFAAFALCFSIAGSVGLTFAVLRWRRAAELERAARLRAPAYSPPRSSAGWVRIGSPRSWHA